MNFKPQAFILGFTAALIIYIVSIFIWQIGFLAPISGGFLFSYMAAINYRNAVINGAIIGGLAALVAIIIAFIGEFILRTAQIPINFFIILGALDVLTGLILGAVGGSIGYYLQKRIVNKTK